MIIFVFIFILCDVSGMGGTCVRFRAAPCALSMYIMHSFPSTDAAAVDY